jgi:hypothetical protein
VSRQSRGIQEGIAGAVVERVRRHEDVRPAAARRLLVADGGLSASPASPTSTTRPRRQRGISICATTS